MTIKVITKLPNTEFMLNFDTNDSDFTYGLMHPSNVCSSYHMSSKYRTSSVKLNLIQGNKYRRLFQKRVVCTKFDIDVFLIPKLKFLSNKIQVFTMMWETISEFQCVNCM
jgi:hypothetical protein